ncbi:MAG TPA: metal ABC transporter permease [Tenuifilaceae bacterium]|nr:metal ABC transporter permease [Tenuifilaceae bacterium]HPQ35706.1 metal ABC transporter permease [Tenuifilaceae bacterium]
MTLIDFLLAPFVACILLIAINVYFGIHVLKREIIFIDIALAQIAAFGTTIATVIHHMFHIANTHGHEHADDTIMAYLLSLAFILISALVFSFLKNRRISIPLEAIIGISYAFATTAAVILLDKAAGSDVHIHDMLIGSILWVSWHQVTKLGIVVVLVALFHFIFRKKFTQLSDNYHKKECRMEKALLWDFLFYLTFGIVIIEAVRISGILTVFAFLILPATFSVLFSKKWTTRIVIGLALGILVSAASLYLSFNIDIPVAPLIIIGMGISLLFAATYKRIVNRIKTPKTNQP